MTFFTSGQHLGHRDIIRLLAAVRNRPPPMHFAHSQSESGIVSDGASQPPVPHVQPPLPSFH